jgi:hypothetical protein
MALSFDQAYSVAAAARLAMDEHGLGRDQCITGGRVAFEILRYFGAARQAVAAEVIAATTLGGSKISGGGITLTPDGLGEFDSKWDGHLFIIADNQWIIDVTADQLDRPQFKLVMGGPLVVETFGVKPVPGTVYPASRIDKEDPEASVEVQYTVTASTVWRSFRPWKDERQWKPIVATAIKLLKD